MSTTRRTRELAIAALIFGAFFFLGACHSAKVAQDSSGSEPSPWQPHPLTIDGSDADWIKPLPGYNRKEGVYYAMTNDRDNLYIMLSAKTPEEQQKILRGGMTVWINTDAEKNNTNAIGIGYPTGARLTREQHIMQQAQPQRYQHRRETVDDELMAYTLYGFKKDETVENFDSVGQVNTEGVAVKIGFNRSGELIYEASVPLVSIYPRNTSHNYGGKSLAVGIFIEGLPPAEGGRRGGGGGSPIGFGGGFGTGSYGSGMGMGLSFSPRMGGGRGGGDRQLYDQAQIWHVLPLARPASR